MVSGKTCQPVVIVIGLGQPALIVRQPTPYGASVRCTPASTLSPVPEINPYPPFAYMKPPTRNDELSVSTYASDMIKDLLLTAQSCYKKMISLFGSQTQIATKQLPEYIEYHVILQPDQVEDSDFEENRWKQIRRRI